MHYSLVFRFQWVSSYTVKMPMKWRRGWPWQCWNCFLVLMAVLMIQRGWQLLQASKHISVTELQHKPIHQHSFALMLSITSCLVKYMCCDFSWFLHLTSVRKWWNIHKISPFTKYLRTHLALVGMTSSIWCKLKWELKDMIQIMGEDTERTKVMAQDMGLLSRNLFPWESDLI